ncbi:MAG: HIT domain-containing protein [Rhodothermales bacterium]|nr:HIT domain-containing protein [Rhodothermales bacterium]
MDHLWSPWRKDHVAAWAGMSADDKGSVFEDIAASDKDEDNLVVWRAERWYVVLNLYPYNNGHCLVVPYRKVDRYTDLTPDEQAELASVLDHLMRALERAYGPDGMNVGLNQGEAAGAGIPDHLHVHVVPRWTSDTNFMPATAGAKVIPESLQSTWTKLREALAAEE